MSGYFYEPAERGRLCVIRFKAPHYTGGGEVVARNVELELAKTICAALNGLEANQSEIARLREALEFYANPEIYKPHPHGPAFDRRDLSYHAISALKSEPQP